MDYDALLEYDITTIEEAILDIAEKTDLEDDNLAHFLPSRPRSRIRSISIETLTLEELVKMDQLWSGSYPYLSIKSPSVPSSIFIVFTLTHLLHTTVPIFRSRT